MVIEVSLAMFVTIVEAHYQALSKSIPYPRQALEIIYNHVNKNEFKKEPRYLEVASLEEEYKVIPWETFALEYGVQLPENPSEVEKFLKDHFDSDPYSFELVGILPEEKTIICHCFYW